MTNRIEEIKNRKLSKHDEQSIAALAAKTGDIIAPENKLPPQEPAQPEKVNPPSSIVEITKHYFVEFRESNDAATACALAQAAMQLEGAALIAKAIKERK